MCADKVCLSITAENVHPSIAMDLLVVVVIVVVVIVEVGVVVVLVLREREIRSNTPTAEYPLTTPTIPPFFTFTMGGRCRRRCREMGRGRRGDVGGAEWEVERQVYG